MLTINYDGKRATNPKSALQNAYIQFNLYTVYDVCDKKKKKYSL